MDHDRHHDLPIDPDLPDEPYQPLHLRPAALGLVLVGGMAGTGARLWAEESVHPWGAWPAATFLVNLVGAFVLGGLLEGTGFLGAFTTYSSLAVEAALLGRDSLPGLGLLYAVGSVVLGFLACAVGIWAASTHARRGRS